MKVTNEYRIILRRMLNQSGERTFIPAIIPPGSGHVHTVFEIAMKEELSFFAGMGASVVVDFL